MALALVSVRNEQDCGPICRCVTCLVQQWDPWGQKTWEQREGRRKNTVLSLKMGPLGQKGLER
jgi:hypothetical protein